ncbi:hypothetical protein OEZ86_004424 [Tetradesmus obliquus]|nr:hypothetical protein OEZ86_004424 [Tetradesmus obliquus]
MELEVLRSQLQLETSARKEHEVQCAAKTRQLWQLREQHEREVRRLQDQLSVVRASLLQHLAHKAALELKAPSIDWYYLEEGGSVRGPHDAALMIRWFCSFFLEDHLPVAGVLQQADGSSRQPPGTAFQPLHLVPAAVMSDGAQQRHSAAGQQQQQQRGAAQLAGAGAASKTAASSAKSLSTGLAEQQPAPASGAVADMSEFAAEAVRQVRSVVAAAQLPGVWRVESLHQMLRAVSPEPASRAAAAAPGKGGR